MKRIPVYVTGSIILLAVAISSLRCKAKSQMPQKAQQGFAVVELFTSEGCSSCPAADAAVARLAAEKQEAVYVLAYHVDYWNRLGWKDSFSDAAYSRRQNDYAAHFNLNSIYTPQVVVNGTSQFVGSNEAKLKSTIVQTQQQALSSDVSITATKTNDSVNVHYAIAGDEEVWLNFALVQPEATTQVKRGENAGRTLHHVNIVRSLQTMAAHGKGTAAIAIPKELAVAPLQIMAFTQSKKTLKVLGADRQVL